MCLIVSSQSPVCPAGPSMGTGMPRAGLELQHPGIPQRWHRPGAGGAPCILSLQQQGRGQRKNGKKEEKKRNHRHEPHRQDPLDLPLSSALRSCSAGTRPQSRIPAKLMYKNPISLLKAGHLATLMKSTLVSGSALSTLFYFCPRARFSYYKQDFHS